MKSRIIFICCIPVLTCTASAQSPSAADQVVEGGKVIVELVKIFRSKKEVEKDPGCKGHYADICVVNASPGSLTVLFEHRSTSEVREVVVLPDGKECCLQAKTGVWTYDIRPSGTTASARKGDLLLEGCNNVEMKIME